MGSTPKSATAGKIYEYGVFNAYSGITQNGLMHFQLPEHRTLRSLRNAI